MYTMPTVSTVPEPNGGTLAGARAMYRSLQDAVHRGDSDETILANHRITPQTLRVLRRDPLFNAALTELS